MSFLFKFALFPLYLKGKEEAKKLAQAAPKIKELRDRYKDDPSSLLRAQQKYYEQEDISPLKGIFLQMLSLPVYYGSYLALSHASSLGFAGKWLWITDLSSPDPLFIIPISMSLLIIVNQIFFPTGQFDNGKIKMICFMGLVSSIFMSQIPSQIALFYFCMAAFQLIFDLIWKHRDNLGFVT